MKTKKFTVEVTMPNSYWDFLYDFMKNELKCDSVEELLAQELWSVVECNILPADIIHWK